ncbi:hypothetical protein CIK05_09605 [Bdellovibrio sp. qaytius]|nr:hypothetical protein CIK05_09605 [Bdellovibrio sp. qaytius]
MKIDDLISRFKKVEKLLEAKPWFKNEKWIVSVHPFPPKSPEGVTLQVFKKNWFNDERQGIHFESYFDLNPKKQKKTYVTLHALHADEIPGTKISRKEFAKPLVDQIHDEVASWEGYEFRTGKYGQQPFTKFLDATDEKFETHLAKELMRLCERVGPQVDKVLKSLT